MTSKRQNMLRLPMILLQLQPHLPHPLAPLTRLNLVRLVALRGILGARLLVHLLPSPLPLLVKPLDDIDRATLRDVVVGTGGIRALAVVMAVVAETAEQEAAAR